MINTSQQDTDLQIAICGSAGDGTIAVGDILKHAMARAGYRVIAFDQYPAEIRGFGKCVSRTRITSHQTYSIKPGTDILVSLNDTHAIPHTDEVVDFGAVIYESAPISLLKEGTHISAHLKPGHIPYGLRSREISEESTGGNRSRNIVALGFVAGLYHMPRSAFVEAISNKFKTKPAEITESNCAAFDAGYELGLATFRFDQVKFTAPPRKRKQKAEMMNGNQAVVRGCLDAGIHNYFGYPITPATTIMERLAVEMPRQGGRLLQTEDEISAISATIGAGYAGARAATATSGPGLALMSEMLGLGVMAEIPCVVFVSQRGGPSTGMPTKTEQSDLNIAVFGGAGDAKRIVLAPTNVEGCWRCASKAFEIAEKYQVPVIVLLDLYLSNRYETAFIPEDKELLQQQSDRIPERGTDQTFARFKFTASGVSPRALPGDLNGIHTATGLEHNEYGRPSDSPQMHEAMSEKRYAKLNGMLKHPKITKQKRFGDSGPVDVGLLTWGSTFGEALEAMMLAQQEGIRCTAMKVVLLSPFPAKEVEKFANDCKHLLVPEVNYEGQFAQLVSGHLGIPLTRLNRVEGAPMSVRAIVEMIRTLAKKS